jgi:cytochrome oxidase Cu insertion factor (SCO1/SenC/PrrC family)
MFIIVAAVCLLVLAVLPVVTGGCARTDPARMAELGVLLPGAPAVDFTLKDVAGADYTLSQLYTEKPVVMVFGSIT